MSEENLYGLPPKKIMELRKSQKINNDIANSLTRSAGSKKPKPKKLSDSDIKVRVRLNVECAQYLSSL